MNLVEKCQVDINFLEENYFKEIIWRNHKVKVFVFWDNESKFTKKIIISYI